MLKLKNIHSWTILFKFILWKTFAKNKNSTRNWSLS